MKELFQKYREVIVYLIFGGLTTLVNWAVFFPLFNLLKWNEHLVNIIAWIAAVAFAFFTNRKYVFRSESGNMAGEAVKFTLSRLTTLGIEELMLLVCCNLLKFNTNIIKLIAAVVVIILNYVFSKLLVFRRGK